METKFGINAIPGKVLGVHIIPGKNWNTCSGKILDSWVSLKKIEIHTIPGNKIGIHQIPGKKLGICFVSNYNQKFSWITYFFCNLE